jgi:hypothetical protein
VAFTRRPAAAKQPKPVVQTRTDLARRHRPAARRRQFHRERDPIQAHTNDASRVQPVRSEIELRSNGHGSLDEQRQRVVNRQRRQREHVFPPNAQRLASRRLQPHRRTRRPDGPYEFSNSLEQVLTVVEHDQRVVPGQPVAN